MMMKTLSTRVLALASACCLVLTGCASSPKGPVAVELTAGGMYGDRFTARSASDAANVAKAKETCSAKSKVVKVTANYYDYGRKVYVPPSKTTMLQDNGGYHSVGGSAHVLNFHCV